MVRQRSVQKGKSGSVLVTGFLQMGQRSLIRLGIFPDKKMISQILKLPLRSRHLMLLERGAA